MTIFGHLVKSRDPALLKKTRAFNPFLSSIRENLTLLLICNVALSWKYMTQMP